MASVTGTASSDPGPGVSRAGAPMAVLARDIPAPVGRKRFRWPLSKLTLRILAVNLVALAIVAGGILYLNQYQEGLVAQRLDALGTQGDMIAAALGETAVPRDPTLPQALDPVLGRQLVQRLAIPIRTRARLFDGDGVLIADTRMLAVGGVEVRLRELPPPRTPGLLDPWLDRLYGLLDRWQRRVLPLYREYSDQRAGHYPEALQALGGVAAATERVSGTGNTILLVAVPVQRFKEVVGALLLSSGIEDIEARVRIVRGDILRLSLLALAVTALLSVYLARSIARPIRRLAKTAERVTGGRGRGVEIPDLSARRDEIGELSIALRQMTDALWQRIDAIEGFAADVAHELKNPLTSIRSAVETIQRVDDPATRDALLSVVIADIRRMDRLISDISASSRLDAELARAEAEPVDLTAMLATLVDVHNATASPEDAAPKLVLSADRDLPIVVAGVEERLVQVFRNLIDNAVSFSPPAGEIVISLHRDAAGAVVVVRDQGPGLPPGKIETVFERFYSDRPVGEAFGTHSGLGLSISKQIVEAHGGTITAENRLEAGSANDGPNGAPSGAKVIVRLPA
ncbi:MAG: stimulus-sensing domain-containing protein [Alphaproteobacteria bacterium]|nr:stimulus-sensing domain-containing protein [Alphaproteobacteria bacterium]MDP6516499.1 stimulus-sensing domain-containing protein [Alphaproteobacteria bacterium]